ncbi:hypothetical protein [Microbacterium timonense]|uniref:hypothetical protein n=1 Tax=Microbacterium timonense TaxID=2086576 RepID=UPI000D112BE0|nr:hypothetical protein [Microbacterium timonense]
MPNPLINPTVRAVVVAQELAQIPTQTERQMRIGAELLAFEKHPEQAVIFAQALPLALLALLDQTVRLAGERAAYDPRKAARVVKRSLRRKGRR